jgi:hypothetical protein
VSEPLALKVRGVVYCDALARLGLRVSEGKKKKREVVRLGLGLERQKKSLKK